MSSARCNAALTVATQTGHISALSVAYIAAEANGQIIGASNSAAALLGYNNPILPGHWLHEVCLPLAGSEDQIRAISAGQLPQLLIERINIKDANERCWYISLVVLPQSPGVLVVISDVTLQSVQEQRLQQQHYELALLHDQVSEQNSQLYHANDQLIQVSQRKSDMLAMATHDLRSPLTTLRGYGSLLHNGAFGLLTSEQIKPIDAMMRQTERMLDIITSFLDLHRLEEQQTFQPYLYNLDSIVNQSVRAFRDQAAFAGIRLSYSGPATPCVALVDAGAIEQALANVISNALKYTQREGHVTVQLAYVGELSAVASPLDPASLWCAIRVTDTGLGIAQADIRRIFEPFFRTVTAQESRLAGSGLGLSIVQRVVQQHNGRVQVQSEPGIGSTFTIYLPCSH